MRGANKNPFLFFSKRKPFRGEDEFTIIKSFKKNLEFYIKLSIFLRILNKEEIPNKARVCQIYQTKSYRRILLFKNLSKESKMFITSSQLPKNFNLNLESILIKAQNETPLFKPNSHNGNKS